ncbi:2-hydroxymuconate tautomerase [Rhizobiaceae sp. 2RAB30]
MCCPPKKRRSRMPFVVVEMWEGRTVEQKRNLVKAITKAMVEEAACKPDHLHVVIHETPKDSWGRGGVLGIDMVENKK